MSFTFQLGQYQGNHLHFLPFVDYEWLVGWWFGWSSGCRFLRHLTSLTSSKQTACAGDHPEFEHMVQFTWWSCWLAGRFGWGWLVGWWVYRKRIYIFLCYAIWTTLLWTSCLETSWEVGSYSCCHEGPDGLDMVRPFSTRSGNGVFLLKYGRPTSLRPKGDCHEHLHSLCSDGWG